MHKQVLLDLHDLKMMVNHYFHQQGYFPNDKDSPILFKINEIIIREGGSPDGD